MDCRKVRCECFCWWRSHYLRLDKDKDAQEVIGYFQPQKKSTSSFTSDKPHSALTLTSLQLFQSVHQCRATLFQAKPYRLFKCSRKEYISSDNLRTITRIGIIFLLGPFLFMFHRVMCWTSSQTQTAFCPWVCCMHEALQVNSSLTLWFSSGTWIIKRMRNDIFLQHF